jgi:predicted flavoprotein YhiN
MKKPARWDLDYDVVVAGYGYAGAVSAVTASDSRARTVILEEMAHFGGNSILSGGGIAVAYGPELALHYLRRTCLDTTDDDVLQAFAQGLVELPDMLTGMASPLGFEVKENHRGGVYPFPGSEGLGGLMVSRNEAYQGFPWAKGTRAGGTLFWVVAEHIKSSSKPPHRGAVCGQ